MLSQSYGHKLVSLLSRKHETQQSILDRINTSLQIDYCSLLPEGQQYYKYQREIAQSALSNQFTLVLNGRRTGITEMCFLTATVAAIRQPHRRILFLVPTQGMKHIQYRNFSNKLICANIPTSGRELERITFENGSEIHFVNAVKFMSKPSAFSGYDNVIIQEAAMVSNLKDFIVNVGRGINANTKILCCTGLYLHKENNDFVKEMWYKWREPKFYIPSSLAYDTSTVASFYTQETMNQELEALWPDVKTIS